MGATKKNQFDTPENSAFNRRYKINRDHPLSPGKFSGGDIWLFDPVRGYRGLNYQRPISGEGSPSTGIISKDGWKRSGGTGTATTHNNFALGATDNVTRGSVLMRLRAKGTQPNLVYFLRASGIDWYWTRSGNGLSTRFNANGSYTLEGDNDWHDWAFVWDRGTPSRRIYVDGVLIHTIGISWTDTTAGLVVGGTPADERYGLIGDIKHIAYWPGLRLNQQQIIQIQHNFKKICLKPIQTRIYYPISASGPATITGTGTLVASAATMDGNAVREITGSGSLLAGEATIAGVSEREITGSGTLQAGNATISGAGTVGDVVTGSGSLEASPASISGAGVREVTGSGTLAASPATMDGAGLRLVTGTGALYAGTATIAGVALRTVTGSGTLQASAASMDGGDAAAVSDRYATGGDNVSASVNTSQKNRSIIHGQADNVSNAKAA